MKLQATYKRAVFKFKQPSGTSRGVLTEKIAWFIFLSTTENPVVIGTGECSIIPGLSPDFQDKESYEEKIQQVCKEVNTYAQDLETLADFPSILFGLEMALLDLKNGGKKQFFETLFSQGQKPIPINGLIWMGTPDFMHKQIQSKINEGFSCIKMKIGAIDFEQEIELLQGIRANYSKDQITLRVDANGAFSQEEALSKLERLAQLDLHSIEQPIAVRQLDKMADLCKNSPLPIALDEELIGYTSYQEKENLLNKVNPPFIILKPSLIGGFKGTSEWIALAEEKGIHWWITSALESNIGLNAIAQFTAIYDNLLPQGLGTGALYTNNVASNLQIKNGELWVAKEN